MCKQNSCSHICILFPASQDNLEICESTNDINTLNLEAKPNDGSEKPCMSYSVYLLTLIVMELLNSYSMNKNILLL